MEDTAAFKFASLPGWTFVLTRYTKATRDPDGNNHSEGGLRLDYFQDGEKRWDHATGTGPVGAPSEDKPFVPGGRAELRFRSLPGYTFWVTRAEQETRQKHRDGTTSIYAEGLLRLGYKRDGEDEDHDLWSQMGPNNDRV